jgi:hypothetical protein
VDYLLEVALGTEYGEASPTLRRWTGDLRLTVLGAPTPQDLATLERVMAELEELIPQLELSLVAANGNVAVYFVPRAEFPNLEPNYVPGNIGFFWYWWNGRDVINRARVLIDAQGTTQRERDHLIREELTQSLGLGQDSSKYPDSIFYQSQNHTDHYAPIDREIIALLYDDRLGPGLTRAEIERMLAVPAD